MNTDYVIYTADYTGYLPVSELVLNNFIASHEIKLSQLHNTNTAATFI